MSMLNKPWYFTGIFVATVFVASMFFGYYTCKTSETCTAPFVGDFDELSQEEIQSKLLSATERRERRMSAKKRREERLGKKTILDGSTDVGESAEPEKVEEDSEVESVLYYEKVPNDWNPSNIIIASGSGGSVSKKNADLARLALYPFHKMIPKTKSIVYIHDKKDALGKGYRAYASEYGKVVNIIAPEAYSFRRIPDREWINILRHEFGHVFQDQIFNSIDRKNWDKLVLERGKVKKDAQFSKYAGRDNYEILAEFLLSSLFMDADELADENELLKKIYVFLFEKFEIEHFADKRDTYEWNESKKPKDATRAFDDYPLPKFVL